MTENAKCPRRPLWAGITAVLNITASFFLHTLYGRLHWPSGGAERAPTSILDALHLGALAMGILAVIFSILCLLKGNRWLGLIAFALAIGAVFNSMICF